MKTIQTYNITPARAEPLPVDREEIVTLSRDDLDAIIEQAVKRLEKLFIESMGSNSAATDVALGKKWMETKEAAFTLGKRPSQLREMVKDGRLRLGIEVRDDRPKNAINPVYVFHVEKCEKRLLTPPEKRGE